jgi:hypothetical protein
MIAKIIISPRAFSARILPEGKPRASLIHKILHTLKKLPQKAEWALAWPTNPPKDPLISDKNLTIRSLSWVHSQTAPSALQRLKNTKTPQHSSITKQGNQAKINLTYFLGQTSSKCQFRHQFQQERLPGLLCYSWLVSELSRSLGLGYRFLFDPNRQCRRFQD